MKEILGDAYNYLEAENGNQAIRMIGENIGIDLMLLDINMPQMNGFEVLKIMKRSQCIAETPVIMISSEDAVDTMRKAYELGITALFNTSFGSLIPWLLPHSFTCVCMKNLLTDRRIYLVYTQKTNLSIPYYHSTNKATCVINLLGSVCAGGPSR